MSTSLTPMPASCAEGTRTSSESSWTPFTASAVTTPAAERPFPSSSLSTPGSCALTVSAAHAYSQVSPFESWECARARSIEIEPVNGSEPISGREWECEGSEVPAAGGHVQGERDCRRHNQVAGE